MTESVRTRAALGYLRRYPRVGKLTTEQLRLRLAECAEANGYELLDVHVEELHSDPTAFLSLVAAITSTGAEAVVVPTWAHLGREDLQDSKIAQLRRTTSAEVLILSHTG